MNYDHDFDADLFERINVLLEEQARAEGEERRHDERRAYRCIQLMAPFDGQRLPSQAAFRAVRCHDISATGFSFYADDQPATDMVIIALGTVPFTFFAAEIVRITESSDKTHGRYTIGSRFVQRITH